MNKGSITLVCNIFCRYLAMDLSDDDISTYTVDNVILSPPLVSSSTSTIVTLQQRSIVDLKQEKVRNVVIDMVEDENVLESPLRGDNPFLWKQTEEERLKAFLMSLEQEYYLSNEQERPLIEKVLSPFDNSDLEAHDSFPAHLDVSISPPNVSIVHSMFEVHVPASCVILDNKIVREVRKVFETCGFDDSQWLDLSSFKELIFGAGYLNEADGQFKLMSASFGLTCTFSELCEGWDAQECSYRFSQRMAIYNTNLGQDDTHYLDDDVFCFQGFLLLIRVVEGIVAPGDFNIGFISEIRSIANELRQRKLMKKV